MKIVAFMQNPWFEEGTLMEVVDRYRTEQAFHQQLLKRTMSGTRLHVAFGEYWFREIWWDNANPHFATTPNGRLDPDIRHIESVIAKQCPDLIITFGKQAEDGVMRSVAAIRIKVMCCHHPNARFKTQADLDNFAFQVIQEAKNIETREGMRGSE